MLDQIAESHEQSFFTSFHHSVAGQKLAREHAELRGEIRLGGFAGADEQDIFKTVR